MTRKSRDGWWLRIQDPTGKTRTERIPEWPERTRLGYLAEGESEPGTIGLRDPSAPRVAAWIERARDGGLSPFWVHVPDGCAPARMGDLCVRRAALAPGLALEIGGTRITLLQPDRETDGPPLPEQPPGVPHWLTCSDAGAETLWLTQKAAATPLSLYLAGETGTGKEVLAHLIHAWSERAEEPFVPLHCAALPIGLIESELFGHVKGAFTGAHAARKGALLQAHRGTLFLDEIGDLPMDIQVKLLRFLENGEIRPVGSDRTARSDVRLVCATHRPLTRLVEEGVFRRDLYYRLASVTIELPALRDRPEDIALLAARFAAQTGQSISAEARVRLQAHDWPGNVRELRHAVERACGLAGPFVRLIGENAFDFLAAPDPLRPTPGALSAPPLLNLEAMERHLVLKALRITGGNRQEAAKILGIARSTLFAMLRRHGILAERPMELVASES